MGSNIASYIGNSIRNSIGIIIRSSIGSSGGSIMGIGE